jgi:CRP-like cAMP-binding protein
MNIANIAANEANRLLAMLPAEDWQAIKKLLTIVTPPTGTILQEIGEPMDHVYFPHSGMISLLTVMKDGRAIETATIGSEGAVGAEMALGVTTAITRGVVQMEMIASRISRKDFMRCVERRAMIQSLAFRSNEALIGQTQQTAACNALHQIEARLARWLLQSQDRSPAKGMVPLTQEFLSEMLAVRRTSVSTTAHVLQSAGLIKYSRGAITIVNRDGLKKKSCECYAAIAKQTERLLSKPLA